MTGFRFGTLADLAPWDADAARAGIEETFFLCSEGAPALDGAARRTFFRDWCGRYLDRWPAMAVIAAAGPRPCAGYLVGCPDTAGEGGVLGESLFYFKAFEDCYADYPAHFHVNVRPEFQGRGLGGALVEDFAGRCRAEGKRGLHLVTGAFARNRAFYGRCGFEAVARRRVRGRALVLMGRAV